MSEKTAKKMEFKTEIKQLLDLVIHSLYSHKEIFLRELISNSADAIDKLRFESLTNKSIAEDTNWKIKLIADKKAKTLTISDNGIGMNKAELTSQLGTIAKSGTKEFLEQVKRKKNTPELIGQFGVGFYASFMVAEKVTVTSLKAGEKTAYKWTSDGNDGFEIEKTTKNSQGTDITLLLKKDCLQYLEEWELRSVVKKYSDFVEHPVVMDVERDKTLEPATDDKPAKTETVIEEETLNSRKAIWSKAKQEVSKDEYKEFYKHISHDFEEPFETIHYSAEGANEFKALLYIPKKAPYDIFMRESIKGIHLYIKRVFIMDDCKTLIPEYLRFIKGVVDSSDLPLNVSREILQENAQLENIKKSITTKILKLLSTMQKKKADRYQQFYKEFGAVLKEGIHYDHINKELLSDLLLYQTNKTNAGETKSLANYIEAMPEGQKDIYYILAEDRDKAINSPHLEIFKEKGMEVLLLVDPIDEWVTGSLFEYKGKRLVAVDKADLDLDSDEDKKTKEEKAKKNETKYGELLGFIKAQLDSDIKDVKLSNKLTDSVSCLATDGQSMPENMKQIMRSMGQEVPEDKKTLEINPDHKIVKLIQKMYKENNKSKELKDYISLIHDQAVIADGGSLKDPISFTKKLNSLMLKVAKG